MAQIIALSGFMGSGKTSVGRHAAALLGWDFLDLDEEIERRTGKSIASLFREGGESSFRGAEFAVLSHALSERRGAGGLILALGGGTVTWGPSLELLRRSARVLYLEVSAEKAWERVRGTGRPLARDRASFEKLLASRVGIYRRAADHVIPLGESSIEEVARRVASLVNNHGDADASVKATAGSEVEDR